MAYVATLMIIVVGGFIATLSIMYLVISLALGYVALRLLAAYDPHIFNVLIVTIRATPIKKSQLQGKGLTYGP